MLQYITDDEILLADKVKTVIATAEKSANIKASEYLAFGAFHHTPINNKNYSWGKYYGEFNADG